MQPPPPHPAVSSHIALEKQSIVRALRRSKIDSFSCGDAADLIKDVRRFTDVAFIIFNFKTKAALSKKIHTFFIGI